ncbi:MAG: hypothetical protein GWO26_30720 [Phycisphaerae bacterium]|nr:hypothetical protein [Phycisphaerae bacterium]
MRIICLCIVMAFVSGCVSTPEREDVVINIPPKATCDGYCSMSFQECELTAAMKYESCVADSTVGFNDCNSFDMDERVECMVSQVMCLAQCADGE